MIRMFIKWKGKRTDISCMEGFLQSGQHIYIDCQDGRKESLDFRSRDEAIKAATSIDKMLAPNWVHLLLRHDRFLDIDVLLNVNEG